MFHYFKLNTDKINCNLVLKDKYVLIDGYSGSGKSSFISEVERVTSSISNELDASLPVIIVTPSIVNAIVNFKNSILLCDEYAASLVLKMSLNVDCYCIIITRKKYDNFNMSYRCLYIAQRDDEGFTTILPKYDFTTRLSSINNYDVILIEDSGSGFKFYTTWLPNTIKYKTTGGKNGIKKSLLNQSCCKKILLIADSGGLASVSQMVQEAIDILKDKGTVVDFCMSECFEHVLLCSKYLGFGKDVFEYFYPCYNNTESFCEYLLELNTKGKPFKYRHNESAKKFSNCWLINCDSCDKHDTCKYSIGGNKFEVILKNGPISELLKYVKES